MDAATRVNVSHLGDSSPERSTAVKRFIVPGVKVLREGRAEPFLDREPTLSSAPVQWRGISLESYAVPALFIPRHEHANTFLHLVLSGRVKYEVSTKGRNLRLTSHPGTLFLLPRGTVDEVNWAGPTYRIAVAMDQRFLTNVLEETAHESDIELTEHWNLIDRHISSLLVEMTADLEEGSPAGAIYGESLAHTLAVYLLRRYSVRRLTPVVYKGGLAENRLKRVLDYIAENLGTNISLSKLAAIADMSPHYFSELFKQSTGRSPHRYILLHRIERAKQHLRDAKRSIIDVGLEAGFENPSHFARMFRKIEGTTPSRFRQDYVPSKTAQGA